MTGLLLLAGLAHAGDLVVDGTTQTLNGSHSYTNVQVINGGQLVVTPYDGASPTTGILTLVAERIEVDSTSSIVADGAGYRGQSNADGEGPGAGQGGASWSDGGGGGAHGGDGGDGTGDSCSGTQGPGGTAYGDAGSMDIDMGSAGGAAGSADGSDGGQGATGGGAIWLEAEVIVIDGQISALGHDGTVQGDDATGGGAGGGILLFAAELYCSGTLVARGGDGAFTDDGGGGGGGGVVKQFYDIAGTSCTVDLVGGVGGCSGADGSSGLEVYEVQDWDGDGLTSADGDCDPLDASVTTGTTETCNGVDDDCDGTVDEGTTGSSSWYADSDGDGYGDPAVSTASCSEPSGYVSNADDCDDSSPWVHPEGEEQCDGVLDEDCDGTIDESGASDATTWYVDSDNDGHGDDATAVTACSDPGGMVDVGGDCDDADVDINPGATETCDGVDNDCDGETDPSTASGATTWYADADLDGYGDPAVDTRSCSGVSGYVNNHGDCDDSDSAINPDADEYCDGLDNDCDGTVDPDSSLDAPTWYIDGDSDGYGDPKNNKTACSEPAGWVSDDSDCDDADPTIHRDAAEICDGIDNDCDKITDPDDSVDATWWHVDSDEDGFGDLDATVSACTQPSGTAIDGTDCDDTDDEVNPDADETCNGKDDDCDGVIDPDDSVGAPSWFPDLDEDGWGDAVAVAVSCSQPEGLSPESTDCDDGDPTVNPAADELWYDGIDQDCDGNDADQDLDGYDWDGVPGGTDCDDEDDTIHPAAEEVFYDDVDQDCAGDSDYDADGDGHESATWGGDDCDDADPDTYPGAPDTPGDGEIQDCDDSDEYDGDGDGYDNVAWGGDDCDDARSDVHPGAEEVWYDGVDQDCDGQDDDRDGDGWGVREDCDDDDPEVYPGSEGLDEQCLPTEEAWWAFLGDDDDGCGCTAGPRPSSAGWAVLALLLGVRRRADRVPRGQRADRWIPE